MHIYEDYILQNITCYNSAICVFVSPFPV